MTLASAAQAEGSPRVAARELLVVIILCALVPDTVLLLPKLLVPNWL